MRRLTLALTLLFISIPLCFSTNPDPAWTTESDAMTFQAYKGMPVSAVFGFEVDITNKFTGENDPILGSTREFELKSSDLENSNKISNAMTINVKTNSRVPVSVDLWFSAFRTPNEEGISYLKVTWKKESQAIGDWIYQYYDEQSESYVPFTYKESEADPLYKYQYKLGITYKDASGSVLSNTVQVSPYNGSGDTLHITFYPIAKRAQKTGEGTWGSWSDEFTNIPGEGNVLPGVVDTANNIRMTASVRFSMTFGVKYNSIPANMPYTGTVRVSIQGE